MSLFVPKLKLVIKPVWINQNFVDLVPLPVRKSEDRDDGTGGGQYPGRRVNLYLDTSNPLLSQEDLDLTSEPQLCRLVENAEEDHVPLQHRFPLGREWFPQDRAPPADFLCLPRIDSECWGQCQRQRNLQRASHSDHHQCDEG